MQYRADISVRDQKDKPLKVLFISSGLDAGGAEGMLLRVMEHLDRERLAPVVISLTGIGEIGEKIRELGIQVHDLGISRSGLQIPVLSFFKLRRMIKVINPDVVQTWQYHADLLGGLAARLAGIKTVSWGIRNGELPPEHSKFSTQMVRIICSWLSYQLPKKILFNSREAQAVHANVGYDERKFEVIPNGFDLHDNTPNLETRATVRRELDLSEDTLLVGFFARIDPVKNHEGFLEAAALIHADLPEVHYVMAGRNVDQSNQDILRMIENYKLSKCVHLLGHRNDIEKLMTGIDVHVSASHTEAFPNVIGEAMASGTPSVATDVGDSAWIIGETGKVVSRGNMQALAEGVTDLLMMPLENRQALGRKARARIKEEFEIGEVAGLYQQYFFDLADGH